MASPKAIYGYVRVSTERQADSGESLAAQQQQLAGYAMMRGFTISQMFVEGGVSGSIPLAERPQGGLLLAAVTPGAVIITAKLDRMFRSARDAIVTLEQLKASGVALHMLDLGGDVCNDAVGKMVFTILSAVAENERSRTRERIKDVKRYQIARGAFVGGRRPFGYSIVDGVLQPDVSEQAMLLEMRRLRGEGMGWRELGRRYGHEATTVRRWLSKGGEDAAVGA